MFPSPLVEAMNTVPETIYLVSLAAFAFVFAFIAAIPWLASLFDNPDPYSDPSYMDEADDASVFHEPPKQLPSFAAQPAKFGPLAKAWSATIEHEITLNDDRLYLVNGYERGHYA